jgi:hypothetical protein
MAKYKVLSNIEHNGTLYMPEPPEGVTAPEKVKSASHGQDVPVNAGGVIELTEAEAKALPQRPDGKWYAIEPVKQGKPEGKKK